MTIEMNDGLGLILYKMNEEDTTTRLISEWMKSMVEKIDEFEEIKWINIRRRKWKVYLMH
jgi:hypothetical protein